MPEHGSKSGKGSARPAASAASVPTTAAGTVASLRETWKHLPKTIGLVFHSSRYGTLALAALTLLSAILPLMLAYVGKRIIDTALAGNSAATVRFVGLEFAVVGVLTLVSRTLATVRATLGARLGVDINLAILEKAQLLELSHFEDSEFYDKLTRARREASSRPLSVVTGAFGLVQNALTIIGYVGLLVQTSGFALLALVLAAIPATVAEVRFSTAAYRLRSFRAPETRRLAYIEFLLGNEGNAKEMMMFGLGATFLARYRDLSETLFQEDRALARKRAVWGYLLSLVALAVFYAFYALVAKRTAIGALTIGTLTLSVVAFRQGQQAFQGALSTLGGMFEDNLYMSNLFSYLELDVRRVAKTLVAHVPHAAGIVFEDVGFRYPKVLADGAESKVAEDDERKWALRHVSLTIAPGQRLAIVGENGSGKTTFIKLLTGLYAPTEGRILLDGVPIETMDRGELRQRIGVIFQDFVRYQLSLSENVGVGSVNHLGDQPRIIGALEQGGASELMSELDGGLDAPLGRWFRKEGAELSGGQWQRIALSRAFMRKEADILILDEPTSALDAEAEAKLFAHFQELSAGKTTILISHRFPTVRTADRIVVLAKGRVAEEGSHEELVARGGRYAELFTLQAKGYL